jgi:hypothetical protein
MINHSDCDHERSSSARARCRRGQSGGAPRKQRVSTPKEDEGPEYGVHKSRTPGFRGDECHVCSIERIVYGGTDAFTSLPVLVGENCKWRVKRSENFRVISP